MLVSAASKAAPLAVRGCCADQAAVQYMPGTVHPSIPVFLQRLPRPPSISWVCPRGSYIVSTGGQLLTFKVL